MKTINFKNYFLALLASVAIVSCVQDDDFSVPESVGAEENEALTDLLSGGVNLVSISELKAMYDSDPNGDGVNDDAIPFRVDTDIVVKGYVTSSDLTGNFYKEVYLQDSPDNPSAAIKIILSQVDSYNRFNKGREVYIKLYPSYSDGATGGLYIGEERTGNEVITIGGGTESDQYGTTVTSLSQNQMNATILRSEVTADIVPLNVQFSQIASDHIGMFVQIDNVEFEDNLDGLRYFDPSEDYDTQRTLQSCSGFSYSNMNIETSSFANFKNEMLPTGNGSIGGVVVKTYDGSSLVLALNTTEDVDFNGERCELLNIDDFSELMFEDFQTASNNTNLDLTGWSNFAEEGSRVWREKVYSGNGYAEFSTYNAPDDVNIAWLVSPGIDLDAQGVEFLNFKMAQHHLSSVDNTVEVLVSTDYDGSDVLSATWNSVAAILPTQSNSWYDFIDSGLVDLSSYSGTLYVGFKVTGSGTDDNLDGAYQLDDFTIIAEQ
jgi:hypothetical protein